MKTKNAIDHFGDVKTLASLLKVTPQAIYQWGEDVPEGRDFQLEVLSRGVLRAINTAAAAAIQADSGPEKAAA